MVACTTSVGPGATNLVTAAAVAHVNRLPLLLLPGDTFASRRPDPVLQQLEHFGDATVTANDCLRPVSRFWDRITRPEQLLASLPQALSVLLDPADCGPVTLAMPQDVQAEAGEFPVAILRPQRHEPMRIGPDPGQLQRAARSGRVGDRPLIIAGGGVIYSDACEALAQIRGSAEPAGRRDPGRQGRTALGPSVQRRCDRRDGNERRQSRSRRRPTS